MANTTKDSSSKNLANSTSNADSPIDKEGRPSTISLDVLNGDNSGGGPGSPKKIMNTSTTIVQLANAANSENLNDFQRSSSPKKSPTKAISRGRSDRPPSNSRVLSPRKSKNYLDFDGDDSEEDNDGALSQVYSELCYIS